MIVTKWRVNLNHLFYNNVCPSHRAPFYVSTFSSTCRFCLSLPSSFTSTMGQIYNRNNSKSRMSGRPYVRLVVVLLGTILSLYAMILGYVTLMEGKNGVGDDSLLRMDALYLSSLISTTTTTKQDDTAAHASFSSSSAAHGSAFSPPRCSAQDLEVIQLQLPDPVCKSTVKIPWHNKCPFSFATRCPEARWVSDFFLKSSRAAEEDSSSNQRRTAVYVGCNKAMDAINTLRMLSHDAKVDKFVWRDTFFENQTVAAGHCNQEFEPQFVIPEPAASHKVFDTVVHCLEAMPVTARHLARTAKRLRLDDRLLVRNTAASNENGFAYFPDQPDGKVGVEGLGIDSCTPKKAAANPRLCANVSISTLDSLLGSDPHNIPKVDLLSIDVEGYDFNVLLGAKKVLPHVRYLEFEYNWKGPWGRQPLKTAMEYLEGLGFVCYWAGNRGHVWRITGCWRDSYDLHFWSNVACVNANDPTVRTMADHLEELFQATLREGATLAWEIDREFRDFYKDVKAGYVQTADGISFREFP